MVTPVAARSRTVTALSRKYRRAGVSAGDCFSCGISSGCFPACGKVPCFHSSEAQERNVVGQFPMSGSLQDLVADRRELTDYRCASPRKHSKIWWNEFKYPNEERYE